MIEDWTNALIIGLAVIGFPLIFIAGILAIFFYAILGVLCAFNIWEQL